MTSTPLTNGGSLTRRGFLAGLGVAGLAMPVLSACSSGSGDYEQPKGSIPREYAGRQRIVFWSAFTGDILPVITDHVDRFNKSQSDIYAEIQTFESYDGVDAKLVAGLQAKQIPDVVVLSDISWNRYYLSNTLEPLDDYFGGDFTTDAYHDALLKEGFNEGTHWWTPLARSTPLMYFNKDILRAADLPPRAPETWDEFREWGKEIVKIEHQGNRPRMRAYTGGDDWYYQGTVWSFGGSLSDEALNITIDSPESLTAARFEHEIIHVDRTGYLAQSHTNDFTAGLVATIQASTGSLTKITKTAEFDLGAGFLPKQVDTGVPSGGSGLAIMRYAPPERKKAAFELIKFLAQEEQSADWSIQTGYMPCTKAAMESDSIAKLRKENPNYRVAVEQLEIAQQPDNVRKYVSTCIVEMKNALQLNYASRDDPDEIMTAAAAKVGRRTKRAINQYPEKLKT